jgi:DNA polymerase III epsilon subunit-like protein
MCCRAALPGQARRLLGQPCQGLYPQFLSLASCQTTGQTDRHRALADTEATADIFLRCLDHLRGTPARTAPPPGGGRL